MFGVDMNFRELLNEVVKYDPKINVIGKGIESIRQHFDIASDELKRIKKIGDKKLKTKVDNILKYLDKIYTEIDS